HADLESGASAARPARVRTLLQRTQASPGHHERPPAAPLPTPIADPQQIARLNVVDEFVALFREDAIWTTGAGKLLIGRDAIAEFTKQVLPSAMHDLVPSYEIVHVLFIRADVAAVKVRQRYFSPDGEPVTELGEGTPMYVMSKEAGQWRL